VPSAAAAVAQSGDVIKISAGDYRGDVTSWSANNLTICGIGGRARLFADGKNYGGKGLWVVRGSNITIDSIEFRNTTVPDQNGAGIRAEHAGELKIINSGFYDNENGILGAEGSATVTIDRSEFARNGYGDGYSHNIYIGPAAKLTVKNSFFHEAKIGHNLKSRAKENRIENSYFMDGPSGTASYQLDFPNGGAVYMRGNLVQKGPNADNSTAIAYGAEGLQWSVNTFEMVHNTVAITRSGGSHLYVPSGTQSVKLTANLFAGTGNPSLVSGGFASGNIAQLSNIISLASNIPGVDNIASPNFWPNSTLLGLLSLLSPTDASYTADSPKPMTTRSISGGTRTVGALQAKP
jgi:hypothetical protein